MHALMMERPLLIADLLAHADTWHGDTQVVSVDAAGNASRSDYRMLHRRARQLARALLALDVMPGMRVATLAWNDGRHCELYFAVPGIGAVCHTINPRLTSAQIAWIIDHAQDAIVFYDAGFRTVVEAVKPACPSVRRWIELGAAEAETEGPYEALFADGSDDYQWPLFDERSAASLCYTSGTTGDPKGVLYSHRSTLLHAGAICLPDSFGISARDVILPVVPMFHVNAWGLPYVAAMTGAALVLPGPHLDGASLVGLMDREAVTIAAGVPTVWQRVLTHLRGGTECPRALERIVIGGSAASPAMVEAFEDGHGVRVLHAWGMTESSPLGVVNVPRRAPEGIAPEVRHAQLHKQGRPPFGIDMKIVDGHGASLPHDGAAQGELLLRGHWVTSGYYRNGTSRLRDGWFPTGDIATIDADGFMAITDRVKDVIKSGGEWISSIDLENAAAGCPGVAEAAVIAMPDPQWGERPLLIVVRAADSMLRGDVVLAWLRDRVPRWWLPERVEFTDELPHTATGKVSKLELRKRYG